MNTKVKTILVLSLVVILHGAVAAQERADKQATAEDLRLQLIELQTKEDTLRLLEAAITAAEICDPQWSIICTGGEA